jgi:hypothetical protein
MLVEPGFQLGISGRRGGGLVDEQELELLAQPTLDDDVVAIQAHGQCLARGNLFLHVLVDQALELDVARRSLPGAVEARSQIVNHAGRDDDAVRARSAASLPGRPPEQQRAEQQEVNQRFADESLQNL